MAALLQRLADWCRGWSAADVQSALTKIKNNQQGRAYMPLTGREMVALLESQAWHPKHPLEFGR